jgi:hypothetical protein
MLTLFIKVSFKRWPIYWANFLLKKLFLNISIFLLTFSLQAYIFCNKKGCKATPYNLCFRTWELMPHDIIMKQFLLRCCPKQTLQRPIRLRSLCLRVSKLFWRIANCSIGYHFWYLSQSSFGYSFLNLCLLYHVYNSCTINYFFHKHNL